MKDDDDDVCNYGIDFYDNGYFININSYVENDTNYDIDMINDSDRKCLSRQ